MRTVISGLAWALVQLACVAALVRGVYLLAGFAWSLIVFGSIGLVALVLVELLSERSRRRAPREPDVPDLREVA